MKIHQLPLEIVATPGTNGGYPRLAGSRLSLRFLSGVLQFPGYPDKRIEEDYLISVDLIKAIREIIQRPNTEWWNQKYTEDTTFDLETIGL